MKRQRLLLTSRPTPLSYLAPFCGRRCDALVTMFFGWVLWQCFLLVFLGFFGWVSWLWFMALADTMLIAKRYDRAS
jgi:hypothetical protein